MMHVEKLPTLQGATSTTFTRPPFNESLTIPEIYAFQARNSPTHPLFIYADEPTGGNRKICYPEAYAAIQRAHAIVSKNVQFPDIEAKKIPIVGMLANTDSITYFTFTVGIMHAGLTAFPISTRNSAVGVAHLIRTTALRLLYVSQDPAMQRLSHEACEILSNEGISVHIMPMPQFQNLYNNDDNTSNSLKPVRYTSDPVVLFLHSSGSTAQPKPIPFLNSNFVRWGHFPYYGEIDMAGVVLASHSLPLFHAMGAASLVWTIFSGLIMACFKPADPPTIPTPDTFLRGIVATDCQIVFCVPMFVETWARSPENISILRTLRALVYAGAPITGSVGNLLVAAGVNLVPFYGATESGCLTLFAPKSASQDDCRFFRLSPQMSIEMVPQGKNEEGEIVEPVIIDSDLFTPNVINTTVNGKPAYAMSDLLLRHPTRKNMYRVYGRIDDQLALSTGEKTNPVPLEALFLQDENISAAIMFGRGRFQNGVLLQPAKPFNPANEENLIEFRNLIWPTVEKVNGFAPAHSRIFKEMIIVTNPRKPLEFTPKGTPRRQVCLEAYREEIDAIYEAVKDSSQTDIPVPGTWTAESAIEFVDTAVRRVLRHAITVDDDVFQQGCDSLQATWIRNSLLRAIRSSSNKANVHQVPLTFVYQYPTIRQLGNYFWEVLNGSASTKRHNHSSQVETKKLQMQSLVSKYTQDILTPSWGACSVSSSGETVLLTGGTSRFGCHILAQTARRSDVLKVYVLNRRDAGGTEAEARQRKALDLWAVDINAADMKKVVFVEYDLSKDRLDLTDELYETLRNTVTVIVHNGWRVDFNIGLGSFEGIIRGTRQLLELSLKSTIPKGPRFIFVSSISVFKNMGPAKTTPETPGPASMAVGLGYGESKWVAENICQRVSDASGLRVTILRAGQLSGDSIHGRWNVKEWVPALVKLGKAIGCLPSVEQALTWLPIDGAAAAVSDLLTQTSAEQSPCVYINLVHPRPVAWNELFKPMAKQLQINLIAYEEWLAQLNTKKQALVNGTTEISDDWTNIFSDGMFGDGRFATDHALAYCPSLEQIKPLDSADALRYLAFWGLR